MSGKQVRECISDKFAREWAKTAVFRLFDSTVTVARGWHDACVVSRVEQQPPRATSAASEEPTWNTSSPQGLFFFFFLIAAKIHWVCHRIFPLKLDVDYFAKKVDRLAYILIQPGGGGGGGGRGKDLHLATSSHAWLLSTALSSISCLLRLKLRSQNRCFLFIFK